MSRRRSGERRNGSATMPRGDAAHWSEVLTQEVSRRLTAMVRDMRGASSADSILRGIVITDAEVDRVLEAAHPGGVSDAPEIAVGSLARLLQERASGSAAHLAALQQRFGLQDVEMDCLLVCLASEVQPKLSRVFGYLNDSVNLHAPSLDTLLRLVAPGDWSQATHLARDGRLIRYGLLTATGQGRTGQLTVADGVVRYALRQSGIDIALAAAWYDEDAAPLASALWDGRPELGTLADLLRLGAAQRQPLVVNLHGRAGSGRRHLAQRACQHIGAGCLTLDARRIRRGDETERVFRAAFRDSVLMGAPVLLHHADAWLEDAAHLAEIRAQLQPLVRELGWILLIASEADLGTAAWFPAARVVDVELPPLSIAARETAWTHALSVFPVLPYARRSALAATLAAKFRLTHGEIALATQRASSVADVPSTDTQWASLLHRCAGLVAAPRLQQLAQAMTVQHTLDDLVLPSDRLAALQDIVRRVRYRRTVLEDWVFDEVSNRGRGLIALFYGPSGTGKTMAAEALASALGMQLFRIDLAGVVSKYIGETEKNLRAIFDEADRADALLFFDEADALFGRRSEVRDSHDRYANIEINYLLQRVELFEGVAILASNMRANIDEAFLRRIHVTVEFPFPRASERLSLWDRSFPAGAPVADDIDWSFLAQRFELTGGAIRNAALGAAFLAADSTGVIGMPEVINALRAELLKAGGRVADGEFGPYARYLAAPAAPARRQRRARLDSLGHVA